MKRAMAQLFDKEVAISKMEITTPQQPSAI